MTHGDAIRALVVLGAIAALTFIDYLISAKRLNRARLPFMPILALVYAVAGTVFLTVKRKLVSVICTLLPILADGEVPILNLLLLGGFIALKTVALPIVLGIWSDDERIERWSGRYYELDERYRQWFLRKKTADLRSVALGVMLAAAAGTFAVLAVVWCAGEDSAMWAYVFPAAVLIPAVEIYGFLNGKTREEFSHDVGGVESDSRRIKNYYKIREIYEKLFEPNVLASHTGSEFAARSGSTQTLQELSGSDDGIKKSVAEYFNTYDDGRAFDNDSIQATVSLLEGRSVVFFNPFYRDLTAYLTLPLVNTLLHGKRCLVIAGRGSTGEDAAAWLEETLKDYSHVRSLWRVRGLTNAKPDCEVGVLSFRELYDVDVLAANREFFNRVGFILLLEPSVMVNTGQVGLSVICEESSRFGDKPVYCICDRYTDGLVDTMSHLLRTEITDVVAAPTPRSTYSGMAFNADGDFIRQDLFDKQVRFLGNGVELAAVAVKNQVPLVTWYGERKAPLRDIKWIAGQYYSSICRYMGIPSHQKSLYERIRFVSTLWSTVPEKEQFIIVEDEFCNIFSTMRAFLSRGSESSFVNVLSENYLLRDYMRCNQQMFLSNPNAIPSIVPDYAKTERNTVLKLILKMAVAPIAEDEIMSELLLVGCRVDDVLDTFSGLMLKYTGVDGTILEIRSVTGGDEKMSVRMTNYYGISRGAFDKNFARTLKTAYYIVEDEKRETEYIDAKMFGHVAQTVLPGQFVTYFGKYYQVKMVSPVNGIILRRASDLYNGRRYYRQLRTYHFGDEDWSEVKYSRTVMDVEVSVVCADFTVTTTGYLDMGDMHDLRSAKLVGYEGDPNSGDYDREYRSKNVLRIKLPETDERIRFTMCLLLSELFHSVFPDAWQYLAVLAKRPDDIEGVLNYAVYAADGNIGDEYIYIAEDSSIDLGLLDAVNRNLPRLLEIIADFLDWHFEKMCEPEMEDPVPEKVKMPEEAVKRRNVFLRMADRIRSIFSRKKHEDEPHIGTPGEAELSGGSGAPGNEMPGEAAPESGAEDRPAAGEGGYGPGAADTGEDKPAKELPDGSGGEAEPVHIDGTGVFEDETMPGDGLWLEDAFKAAGIAPAEQTRYQRECYLKYGFDEIDGHLRIEDVRRYLHLRGYSDNALTRARRGGRQPETDLEAVNHCDFCGKALSGVSYDVLSDGRVRCNDCSSSAIVTVEEFTEVFYKALELMEMFYEVTFHVPITVRMADARTVAKGSGSVFKPSTEVAARTLGYAQRRFGKYSVIMENGSPRLATVDTMVHELTHIWQYLNWDDGLVRRVYGMGRRECTATARDIVYEGMAMWAAIQYLYQIGETYYASQQEEETAQRSDVYGVGFRLYREQYPLVKDMSIIRSSPYRDFPTIDPEKVKEAVRGQCQNKHCRC